MISCHCQAEQELWLSIHRSAQVDSGQVEGELDVRGGAVHGDGEHGDENVLSNLE